MIRLLKNNSDEFATSKVENVISKLHGKYSA